MSNPKLDKRAMVFLATLSLASIFLVARSAVGQTAQTCSPANPPVIHAGDKVTVVATLATTDPDENVEHGEYLVISSSGGFRAVLSTYGKPQTLTFSATIDGETLLGTLMGSDEDESCVLTVTVTSPPPGLSVCSKNCKFSSGLMFCATDTRPLNAGAIPQVASPAPACRMDPLAELVPVQKWRETGVFSGKENGAVSSEASS